MNDFRSWLYDNEIRRMEYKKMEYTGIIAKIAAELETRKDRSAWNKGVTLYAWDLLDEIQGRTNYEHKEPENADELKEYALNGAESWDQYSWGGSALIYNHNIAGRLCSPSELKKTRNGERRPNSREDWLDTQARALSQAYNRIRRIFQDMKEQ